MTERRPTSIISTIAIQTGQSTRIVVAVLKSVNWVQLRIDSMYPSLLEIGNSVQEASKLLEIHIELMARLRSKQDQIEELLAEADKLVTEQKKPHVAVYEAMADSLGTAWKDLNKQLQIRGNLVEEALRFYGLVEQHDQLLKQLDHLLASGDKNNAKSFLTQFENPRKALLDLTALAMDSGCSVIFQAKSMGTMVDNPERNQEIVQTCQPIEDVMLRLNKQWVDMETVFDEKRLQFDSLMKTGPLWQTLEHVEKWLQKVVIEFDSPILSSDPEQIGANFQRLFDDAQHQHSLLLKTMESADNLFLNLAESSRFTDKSINVRRQFDDFFNRLEMRRKNCYEVVQFLQSANYLLQQMDSMYGDIKNANSGMAGELGPLARQKAKPLIKQGQILRNCLSEDPWAFSIAQKTSELEQKLDSLEQFSLQRRRESDEKLALEHKQKQEIASRIYTIIEEIECWIRESWEILDAMEIVSKNVQTYEEAERIGAKIDNFSHQQLIQEKKIKLIEENAHKMHVEEYDDKVQDLKLNYRNFVDRLYNLSRKIQMIGADLHLKEQMRKKMKLPMITVPLKDTQVDEGLRLELTALIEGDPEPSIFWLKNGVDLSGNADYITSYLNGTATLRIEEVLMDDAAVYTVMADNAVGKTESSAKLTVKSRSQLQLELKQNKPRFFKQLKNITANEGNCVQLNCTVVGQPEPEIIWYREELPIKECSNISLLFKGDHCSLTIREAMQNDTGMYKAVARNNIGEATSFCRLNVQVPPSPPYFSPPLVDCCLVEGEKYQIDVRVFGNPFPNLSWKFNSAPLNVSDDIQLFDRGNGQFQLVIDHVTSRHAGIFTVEASNSVGKSKSEAVLTINFPPNVIAASEMTTRQETIETKHEVEEYGQRDVTEYVDPSTTVPELVRSFPRKYLARFGESLRLDCIIVGNPPPKIRCYFDDRSVIPNTGFCRLTNNDDTYSIVIDSVTLEHQGTFTLIAENIRGRTECKTTVRVTDAGKCSLTTQKLSASEREGIPPHFSKTLVSVVIADNEAAKFEGIVSGHPRPQIQWSKDGQPVDINVCRCSQSRLLSNTDMITLDIDITRGIDSGKYMCTAKNHCGVATSSAQLIVRPKMIAPDFIQRLVSKEVQEGDSLRWEVKITGQSEPTVQWLRDGTSIRDSHQVRLLKEEGGRHILHIVRLEMSDSGQFTCLAENEAGEARSTADLVVRPIGTDPGKYFHVTKVTQAREVQGQEVSRNQAFSIEQPVEKQPRL